MKNNQFWKYNSKSYQKVGEGITQKLSKNSGKIESLISILSCLSKLTVLFNCIKKTYVAYLVLVVYILYQGVSLEFWKDDVLKELGIV